MQAKKRKAKGRPEYMRMYMRKYKKLFRKNRTQFWYKENLDRRLRSYVKGEIKDQRCCRVLTGTNTEGLRAHLEAGWQPGMRWDNYGHGRGRWVIDHIVECCTFDLSDEDQARVCYHVTNIQPMWFEDNITKMHSERRKRREATKEQTHDG